MLSNIYLNPINKLNIMKNNAYGTYAGTKISKLTSIYHQPTICSIYINFHPLNTSYNCVAIVSATVIVFHGYNYYYTCFIDKGTLSIVVK